MLKANEKYISIEEYFAREDTAELRSEYYCGDVFAMAGGTPNHNWKYCRNRQKTTIAVRNPQPIGA